MTDTRPAVKVNEGHQQVQCPYTATTCPLFAPVFTEQEIRTNVSTVPLSYSDYSLTPSAPTPPLHNFCASAHANANSAPRAPPQYNQAPYDPSRGDLQSACQDSNRLPIHRNFSAESNSSVNSQEPRVPPPAPYAPRPSYGATPASYDSRWSGGDSCGSGSGNNLPGQGQEDLRTLDMEDMLGGFGRGQKDVSKPREPSFEPVEIESNEAVTPFISKLSHLLSHADYEQYIRWNRQGNAFIFAHTSPELLNIFSRFFRHSNSNSFVRQLNICTPLLVLSTLVRVALTFPSPFADGFTRLTTLELLSAVDDHSFPETNFSAGDFSGFHHPLFFRDTPDHACDLGKIKPKAAAKKWAAQKAVSANGEARRSRSLKGEGKAGGNMKKA